VSGALPARRAQRRRGPTTHGSAITPAAHASPAWASAHAVSSSPVSQAASARAAQTHASRKKSSGSAQPRASSSSGQTDRCPRRAAISAAVISGRIRCSGVSPGPGQHILGKRGSAVPITAVKLHEPVGGDGQWQEHARSWWAQNAVVSAM